MVLLFLYIYYYKENMNNSDEYMKSKAIAESIQTMLNRISVLECENERLIKYNSNTIAIVNQLKSENALLMNEINVYKNKESVNKELIATYEETIDKMKSKIKREYYEITKEQKNSRYTCTDINNGAFAAAGNCAGSKHGTPAG